MWRILKVAGLPVALGGEKVTLTVVDCPGVRLTGVVKVALN